MIYGDRYHDETMPPFIADTPTSTWTYGHGNLDNNQGKTDEENLKEIGINGSSEDHDKIHRDDGEMKHVEHFHRINIHGHTGDSTAGDTLYPTESGVTGVHEDIRHMDSFHRINVHGHTGDSTAGQALYPSDDGVDTGPDGNARHVDSFHRINIHGHTGDSTAERNLYPDTHDSGGGDDHQDMQHVASFHRINLHGHTGDSTAQGLLYPPQDSNNNNNAGDQGRHVDHFKAVNVHGHVSQSTVQQLLYPLLPGDDDDDGIAGRQENNNSFCDSRTSACVDTDDRSTASVTWDDGDWLSLIRQETSDRSKQLAQLAPLSARLHQRHVGVSPLYRMDTDCPLERSLLFGPSSSSSSSTDGSDKRRLDLRRHPVDLLIERSLVPTIMAQVRLVDAALMQSLLSRFRLRDHLRQIRRSLFLEDGKFSSSLLPRLFPMVSAATAADAAPISVSTLCDLVRSSIDCGHRDDDSDCLCGNVRLMSQPPPSADCGRRPPPNRLDEFCLSYRLQWPLTIVVTAAQIGQYQSVFRAILRIKFAAWCIAETRRVAKSWWMKQRHQQRESSDGLRTVVYSCLAEMEHWVRSIDYSLGNQGDDGGGGGGGGSSISWQRLMSDIDDGISISNIDSLIDAHAAFVDGVVLRCVLAGDDTGRVRLLPDSVKAVRANVRKMLTELLAMCLTFYRLVDLHQWQAADRRNNETIERRVGELHNRFRQYGDCLLRVIRGCGQDSYLEHLFVSLNYNEFYFQ